MHPRVAHLSKFSVLDKIFVRYLQDAQVNETLVIIWIWMHICCCSKKKRTGYNSEWDMAKSIFLNVVFFNCWDVGHALLVFRLCCFIFKPYESVYITLTLFAVLIDEMLCRYLQQQVFCVTWNISKYHKDRNKGITGPVYKHSFELLLSFLDLAEASYTTHIFVVVFSGFITVWWGR